MAIRAEHAPALPREPINEIPKALRSAYAKHILGKHLRTLRAKLKDGVSESDPLPPGSLSHAPTSHDTDEALPEYNGRVAIVGAGATGLYLAMMLKFLDIKNVDIYEASDRIGGRCYTYNFPDDKNCPHNYYDIGAMRIPQIEAMASTLNLIEKLGLPKSEYVLNANCEPQMHYYSNDPNVAPKGKEYEARIKDIIQRLNLNWDHEFEALMKGHDDNYSTRSWLMHTKPRLTYEQTEEAESAETSTGLFDQSFIESLCDYSDFQAASNHSWYRLDGGMSTLTDKMNECIEDPKWLPANPISLKVKTNAPVVAMSENKSSNKIEVTLAGAKKPESYDMVFNTTAMGPLQRMDIAGLVPGFGLPETQKKILTGIRALSYDRASKVAIKFKTRWWKNMYNNPEAHAKFGGVSGTDLAISNVVYPSWDDGDKSAVLMVSYSWAQDATRMGALIPDYSKQDPSIDDTVVKQSFQDLARLWAGSDPTITVDFLRDQYVTHHAHAWSHDPYTGGAFALFGPGQFKYMYPEFQHVFCGGKFAMCGEALSPHHAWISGALDSAYVTLARWLGHHKDHKRIEALKRSWFGKGKNEDPEEYDDNLLYWSVELSKEVTKQITAPEQ